jgi:DNA replication and repair protein RecF
VHRDVSLEFSENLNYIVGGNGYGKTSILESIYYLCTTKSFDAKTDVEVISFGKERFEINGRACFGFQKASKQNYKRNQF